jgi:hypothetical protein
MSELPAPEMVSRQQWIEANLRSMRPVLDRVGGRVGNGMGVLGRPTRPSRARSSPPRSAA